MNRIALSLLAGGITMFLLAGLARAQPASAGLEVAANDRIVFLSSPSSSCDSFPLIVERFVLFRYKNLNVRFYPLTAPTTPGDDKLANLGTVLQNIKPTKIVVGWFPQSGKRAGAKAETSFEEDLQAAYDELLQQLTGTGAAMYFVTPPASIPDVPTPYTVGAHSDQAAGVVRVVAQDARGTLIDWHATTAPLRKHHELTPDALKPFVCGMPAALLLNAWNVEPVRYTINLDWDAATARATEGSVAAEKLDAGRVRLRIVDAPIPWDFGGGSSAASASHPCRRFQLLNLKVKNAPARGVTIGTPSGLALPVLPQLAVLGFDLTNIESIRDVSGRHALDRAINQKNKELTAWVKDTRNDLHSTAESATGNADSRRALDKAFATIDDCPRAFSLDLELVDLKTALSNVRDGFDPSTESGAEPTPREGSTP